MRAPISLRVNPDVDPRTHPYIATGLKESKFGIPMDEARKLYKAALKRKELELVGLDCHIGSQLTVLGPLREALRKLTSLFRELRKLGVPLRYLDVGGGLGIAYQGEAPPEPRAYASVVSKALEGLDDVTLILEPGRVLVGNAGVLLTRVLYRKQNQAKRFVVVDAGMNDLVRPALYGAHHELLPVVKEKRAKHTVDVVGPVCESTDVLAKKRNLPDLEPGELAILHSAGAYGMCMASNYNSRPKPAEVMVDGARFEIVRERETYRDLIRGEPVSRGGRKR